MILRSYKRGDEQLFVEIVNAAYRNFETVTAEHVRRLLSPPYFKPQGFFMAKEGSRAVGCVAVFDLPLKRQLEIRYLAVKDAFSNLPVVNRLIEATLSYSSSERCRLLKSSVLAIQPYVDAYLRFGFKPVRRILRIAWDPVRIPENERANPRVTVVEVSGNEVSEASQAFLKGLQPYWDWWVEQKGGEQMLLDEVVDSMRERPWLAAKINGKIVGVTSVTPRADNGEPSFSGVAVLPEFRMAGVGWALMNTVLKKTRELGYQRLVVHTLAYLDALAPGAALYMKSGGRIEAEYLHLVKELG